MKGFCVLVVVLLVLLPAVSAFAQNNNVAAAPTVTTSPWETDIFARSSISKGGQFLNYSEAAVSYGNWIVFDPGWLNFGHLNYGEGFVGFDRINPIGKKTTIIAELYFDRSYGPASDHANYLQTFVNVNREFGKGWSANGSYFPYWPIDGKGTFQQVLDHLTISNKINRHLALGAGYAFYKLGNTPMINKEYGSIEILSKEHGSLEIMPMHFPGLPGGFGLQGRYSISLKPKVR